MGVYFRLSTTPKYCSNCGSLLFKKADFYSKLEYDAKVVNSCSNCGTRFIKTEKNDLPEGLSKEIENYIKIFESDVGKKRI